MNGCRSPSSIASPRLVNASRSWKPGRGAPANIPPTPQPKRDRKTAMTASGPATASGRRSALRGSRREMDGQSARAGIRNRETGRARSAPASVREAQELRQTPSRRRRRLHQKLKSCAPGGTSCNADIGKGTEPALPIAAYDGPKHPAVARYPGLEPALIIALPDPDCRPRCPDADKFRSSGCPGRPIVADAFSRPKCRSHCIYRCAQCFSSHGAFSGKIAA